MSGRAAGTEDIERSDTSLTLHRHLFSGGSDDIDDSLDQVFQERHMDRITGDHSHKGYDDSAGGEENLTIFENFA